MTEKLLHKRHVCGKIVYLDLQGQYHAMQNRDGAGEPVVSCPRCRFPLEDGWFRALYRIEPMTRGMMERTISGRYACSNCWGYGFNVIDIPADEDHPEPLYIVVCTECQEETIGFVSSGYVGRAREMDYLNHVIVSQTLGVEMGTNKPAERRREQENLAALGFGL